MDGVLGTTDVGGGFDVDCAVGAGDGAKVLAAGGGVSGIAVVGPDLQVRL